MRRRSPLWSRRLQRWSRGWASKEKEVAVSDTNQWLRGIAKTKDIINLCQSKASTSIRAAQSLKTAAESHDIKALREDILNQLLVLLNTAIEENNELRAMEAMTKLGGRPTSGAAAGCRRTDFRYSRRARQA
jgi:hypothetical protein